AAPRLPFFFLFDLWKQAHSLTRVAGDETMHRLEEPVTAEEFALLVPDGQKADLLDGVIYVASPDSREAARVNVFLIALLSSYVSKLRLGEIYGPRSAFRLKKTYAPEPDIAFVRKDRLSLWKGSLFQGA